MNCNDKNNKKYRLITATLAGGSVIASLPRLISRHIVIEQFWQGLCFGLGGTIMFVGIITFIFHVFKLSFYVTKRKDC